MSFMMVKASHENLHGPDKHSKQGLYCAPACTATHAQELLVDVGKQMALAIPVTQKVPAVDLCG
jgi:hypothetical protein